MILASFEWLEVQHRHELAHAAIHQHLTLNSRPTMILSEGWAESCAATTPDMLSIAAARETSRTPPISELVSPTWAWIDDGPIYSQGGAFVQDLLQHQGGEKFLTLYLTCRPETFDADCQRVFGVGLQELQRAYTTRLAKWTAGKRLHRLLSALPIAQEVDSKAWRRFIDTYSETVDRTQLPGEFEVAISGTDGVLVERDTTLRHVNSEKTLQSTSITKIRIHRTATTSIPLGPQEFGLDEPAESQSSLVTWPYRFCVAVAGLQMAFGLFLFDISAQRLSMRD